MRASKTILWHPALLAASLYLVLESAQAVPAMLAQSGAAPPSPEEAAELIGEKLVLYILGGALAGILILRYVVPAFGDWVGGLFYSAPEEIGPDPSSLAVAKIAQGDYHGAIDEYKKLMAENPTDRFPVMEIAKLYVERLDDPAAAIDFLEESLNDKEWPIDDAAFLMFRIVDLELENRQNPARARELLTMVTENFEGTRHSANAEHKIREIDAGG